MENSSSLRKFVKPALIAGGLLIIGLTMWTLLFPKQRAEVVINTDNGADIFVTTSQDEDFQKIGTTKATFRATTLPQTVYIRATKDDRTTISSAVLRENTKVTRTLSLADHVSAKAVTGGKLSNIFMDGTLVQGILPEDFLIFSFKTDEMSIPRVEFLSVPQLKKIIWRDQDNFLYNSWGSGVGRFLGNTHTGSAGLAQTVTDKAGQPLQPAADPATVMDTGGEPWMEEYRSTAPAANVGDGWLPVF